MAAKAIYLLKDEDGNVRYVGYAIDPDDRLKRHLRECRQGNTHRKVWIRSMIQRGVTPSMEVVEWTQDYNLAERQWIFRMRALGCNLVNGSDGGAVLPTGCRAKGPTYPHVKRAYRHMESRLRCKYSSEMSLRRLRLFYEYYRDCLVPSCRKNKIMDWLEGNIEKYGWKFAPAVLTMSLKEQGLTLEDLVY